MDIVGDLARILAPGEQRAALRLRQGKVIAVAADGTATITIGGDTTEISGVAVASHVSAVPGYACWLAVDGRDAFIIATIGPEVAATPTGVVLPTAAPAAPAGWLLCDGALVSRTVYARLFSVIGSTYGAGDGSTTFALPDMRGRVAVGRDSGQTEFDALGEAGGAKSNTHNHWTLVSNDGAGAFIGVSGQTPRSRTATRGRAVLTGGSASGALREDSTYDETINILPPYRVLNHIIKI